MNFDPFHYQVGRCRKRNFVQKFYPEVFTLDEAVSLIETSSEMKLIVHNHILRKLIRDKFSDKYHIKTVTDQGVDFNRNSTIITCSKCKNNAPYLSLKWKVICDDTSCALCKNCGNLIDATDTNNFLSKRHNVLIIKKYKGIIHNKCNKFININDVEWIYNSDTDECYDAICPHCEDFCKICSLEYNNKNEETGFRYVF